MPCAVQDGRATNVSPGLTPILSCLTDGIRWGSMMPLRQLKGVPPGYSRLSILAMVPLLRFGTL